MGLAGYTDFAWIGGRIAVFSSKARSPPRRIAVERLIQGTGIMTPVELPSFICVDLTRGLGDGKNLFIPLHQGRRLSPIPFMDNHWFNGQCPNGLRAFAPPAPAIS